MLLDGSIKFARQARAGLEESNYEAIYLGFTQCRDIVLELLNTIKTDPAPHVAKSMRELYTFMYSELVKASADKDIKKLDEIISLLEYDRETWVLTMEQTAKEREAGIVPNLSGSDTNASSNAAANTAAFQSMEAAPARQPISFQA